MVIGWDRRELRRRLCFVRNDRCRMMTSTRLSRDALLLSVMSVAPALSAIYRCNLATPTATNRGPQRQPHIDMSSDRLVGGVLLLGGAALYLYYSFWLLVTVCAFLSFDFSVFIAISY